MAERTTFDRPYGETDAAASAAVFAERPGLFERPAAVRRISWGAIFAGTVIVMVVQMLLSMLGVGIGAVTIDPASGQSPTAGTLGTGAAIWWVVASIVAVFLGALVASRLAGMPRRQDGVLHGLVTWGFSTLVLFWLVGSAVTGVVGGAGSMLSQAMGAGGQGVQALAGAAMGQGEGGVVDRAMEPLQQEVEQFMRQAGVPPRTLEASDLGDIMRDVVVGGGDRQAAVNSLAENTGLEQAQAEQLMGQLEQRYEQVAAQARQSAEAAAEAVAQASIWAFVAFLLGAIAAAIGGAAGAPRDLTAAGLERRT